MLSGVRSQIAIKIFGDDPRYPAARPMRCAAKLAGIPGIADLEIEKQVLAPQIKVRVDYAAAAQYGVPTPQVLATLQSLVEGEKVAQIVEGNRRFALVVRLPESSRSLEGLGDILIETPNGASAVAHRHIEDGDGRTRSAATTASGASCISANAQGARCRRSSRHPPRWLRRKLPEGYFVTLGGQFQAQEEASRLVGLLSIVSLVLMFVVLFSRYKSVRLSALIMANIPLALVGAGDRPVGFGSAAVGGRVDRLHHARRHLGAQRHPQGQPLHQPDAHGRRALRPPDDPARFSERLAPVLMTALVTAFALAPLLFEAERPGTEILHPVAVVIFSGLISSTLLDTFLTPAMFWLFGRKDAERLVNDRDVGAL